MTGNTLTQLLPTVAGGTFVIGNRELLVGFLVAANAVVLTLGGLITHLAYRAYLRTGTRAMKRFAVGFGLITLGLLFGGGLHQVLGAHVLVGVLAQVCLTALGFGFLAYSLYVETPHSGGTSTGVRRGG